MSMLRRLLPLILLLGLPLRMTFAQHGGDASGGHGHGDGAAGGYTTSVAEMSELKWMAGTWAFEGDLGAAGGKTRGTFQVRRGLTSSVYLVESQGTSSSGAWETFGIYVYDRTERQWTRWQLDSRQPGRWIQARGVFDEEVLTLEYTDEGGDARRKVREDLSTGPDRALTLRVSRHSGGEYKEVGKLTFTKKKEKPAASKPLNPPASAAELQWLDGAWTTTFTIAASETYPKGETAAGTMKTHAVAGGSAWVMEVDTKIAAGDFSMLGVFMPEASGKGWSQWWLDNMAGGAVLISPGTMASGALTVDTVTEWQGKKFTLRATLAKEGASGVYRVADLSGKSPVDVMSLKFDRKK